MSDVAVLIPVLGRPERAKLVADSLRESQRMTRARIVFVCSPGDVDEIAACEAEGDETLIADWPAGPGDYARKINLGLAATREDFVFTGADDLRFHDGWADEAVFVALDQRAGVVGTNDLGNDRVLRGLHSTHSLVSRAYALERGTIDEPGAIFHSGYDHMFCNPPEAPIWMADLSFKPIGEVEVGDRLIGWERSQEARPAVGAPRRSLCYSDVLATRSRRAPIVRVEMESGRTIRCTEDHRWLNAHSTSEWCVPKVGKLLLRVIDEPTPVPRDLERTAAWLGGIYDGEGSGIVVAGQSNKRNPEVVEAIREALDALGFAYSESNGGYEMVQFVLRGGKQGYLDFLHAANPVRRAQLMAHISGWRPRDSSRQDRSPIGARRFGIRDRIVAVEPEGEGEVVSLTTSSGNYIAWGYASRNCDNELVETAQARGEWAFAAGAVVEHLHPFWHKGSDDATYKRGRSGRTADQRLFESRRRLWANLRGEELPR